MKIKDELSSVKQEYYEPTKTKVSKGIDKTKKWTNDHKDGVSIERANVLNDSQLAEVQKGIDLYGKHGPVPPCHLNFGNLGQIDFSLNFPFQGATPFKMPIFRKIEHLSDLIRGIDESFIQIINSFHCCDVADMYNNNMVPIFNWLLKDFVKQIVDIAEKLMLSYTVFKSLFCIVRVVPGNPWLGKGGMDWLNNIYVYIDGFEKMYMYIIEGDWLNYIIKPTENFYNKISSCASKKGSGELKVSNAANEALKSYFKKDPVGEWADEKINKFELKRANATIEENQATINRINLLVSQMQATDWADSDRNNKISETLLYYYGDTNEISEESTNKALEKMSKQLSDATVARDEAITKASKLNKALTPDDTQINLKTTGLENTSLVERTLDDLKLASSNPVCTCLFQVAGEAGNAYREMKHVSVNTWSSFEQKIRNQACESDKELFLSYCEAKEEDKDFAEGKSYQLTKNNIDKKFKENYSEIERDLSVLEYDWMPEIYNKYNQNVLQSDYLEFEYINTKGELINEKFSINEENKLHNLTSLSNANIQIYYTDSGAKDGIKPHKLFSDVMNLNDKRQQESDQVTHRRDSLMNDLHFHEKSLEEMWNALRRNAIYNSQQKALSDALDTDYDDVNGFQDTDIDDLYDALGTSFNVDRFVTTFGSDSIEEAKYNFYKDRGYINPDGSIMEIQDPIFLEQLNAYIDSIHEIDNVYDITDNNRFIGNFAKSREAYLNLKRDVRRLEAMKFRLHVLITVDNILCEIIGDDVNRDSANPMPCGCDIICVILQSIIDVIVKAINQILGYIAKKIIDLTMNASVAYIIKFILAKIQCLFEISVIKDNIKKVKERAKSIIENNKEGVMEMVDAYICTIDELKDQMSEIEKQLDADEIPFNLDTPPLYDSGKPIVGINPDLSEDEAKNILDNTNKLIDSDNSGDNTNTDSDNSDDNTNTDSDNSDDNDADNLPEDNYNDQVKQLKDNLDFKTSNSFEPDLNSDEIVDGTNEISSNSNYQDLYDKPINLNDMLDPYPDIKTKDSLISNGIMTPQYNKTHAIIHYKDTLFDSDKPTDSLPDIIFDCEKSPEIEIEISEKINSFEILIDFTYYEAKNKLIEIPVKTTQVPYVPEELKEEFDAVFNSTSDNRYIELLNQVTLLQKESKKSLDELMDKSECSTELDTDKELDTLVCNSSSTIKDIVILKDNIITKEYGKITKHIANAGMKAYFPEDPNSEENQVTLEEGDIYFIYEPPTQEVIYLEPVVTTTSRIIELDESLKDDISRIVKTEFINYNKHYIEIITETKVIHDVINNQTTITTITKKSEKIYELFHLDNIELLITFQNSAKDINVINVFHVVNPNDEHYIEEYKGNERYPFIVIGNLSNDPSDINILLEKRLIKLNEKFLIPDELKDTIIENKPDVKTKVDFEECEPNIKSDTSKFNEKVQDIGQIIGNASDNLKEISPKTQLEELNTEPKLPKIYDLIYETPFLILNKENNLMLQIVENKLFFQIPDDMYNEPNIIDYVLTSGERYIVTFKSDGIGFTFSIMDNNKNIFVQKGINQKGYFLTPTIIGKNPVSDQQFCGIIHDIKLSKQGNLTEEYIKKLIDYVPRTAQILFDFTLVQGNRVFNSITRTSVGYIKGNKRLKPEPNIPVNEPDFVTYNPTILANQKASITGRVIQGTYVSVFRGVMDNFFCSDDLTEEFTLSFWVYKTQRTYNQIETILSDDLHDIYIKYIDYRIHLFYNQKEYTVDFTLTQWTNIIVKRYKDRMYFIIKDDTKTKTLELLSQPFSLMSLGGRYFKPQKSYIETFDGLLSNITIFMYSTPHSSDEELYKYQLRMIKGSEFLENILENE